MYGRFLLHHGQKYSDGNDPFMLSYVSLKWNMGNYVSGRL